MGVVDAGEGRSFGVGLFMVRFDYECDAKTSGEWSFVGGVTDPKTNCALFLRCALCHVCCFCRPGAWRGRSGVCAVVLLFAFLLIAEQNQTDVTFTVNNTRPFGIKV